MSIADEARAELVAAAKRLKKYQADGFIRSEFRGDMNTVLDSVLLVDGVPRKPEAAPSDTEVQELAEEPFESLVNRASLALDEDGWHSHDEALTWEDLDRIARTVLRTSQPVQVTPEALAAKLYSIEYQVDPDSATPDDVDERLGAADELIAWFAEHTPAQPVQVEVTDDMVERAARALWAAYDGNGDWDSGIDSMHEACRAEARAVLSAALGGGE